MEGGFVDTWKNRRNHMGILCPLAVLLLAGSLFAADPFAGTWKLNLAKSKYGGPMKPPKNEAIFILEQGDQRVDTAKGVRADGSPISIQNTFTNTGGEVQSLGFPAGTSVIVAERKADSRTTDWTITLPSRMRLTEHDVVSDDGKTMTSTLKGTDGQGQPFVSVIVYDRRQARKDRNA
jgi:hypothetical protein